VAFEATDAGCWIVMPFFEEGDLDQAIEARQGQPFELDHIAGLFMQLCRAIQHLHERNIIHRDVKVSLNNLKTGYNEIYIYSRKIS
jgi:serine/threonine protein kinase